MGASIKENLKTVALCAGLAFFANTGWAQSTSVPEDSKRPKVGDQATDFELVALDGEKFNLSKAVEHGPVVVVVLRGYPGYQCPVCSKQVHQFIEQSEKFKAAHTEVVMIYPGAANELKKRAMSFVHGQDMPKNFHMVLDPDYEFTNAWHLRWNAPRETAYPSTFVVGQDRTIRFAKISQSHGGRAAVDQVLAALRDK